MAAVGCGLVMAAVQVFVGSTVQEVAVIVFDPLPYPVTTAGSTRSAADGFLPAAMVMGQSPQ